MKVDFFDKGVRDKFWVYFSVISGVLSFIFLFDIIPIEYKEHLKCFGYITFILLTRCAFKTNLPLIY